MISLSRMQPLSPSSQTSLINCITPTTSPNWIFIGVITTFISITEMSGKQLLKLVPVTCQVVPVTCQVVPVTCQVVPVTCQVVPVTCQVIPCHLSHNKPVKG